MQIFILSADRHVLHALPGFWHPEDLARALRFALTLDRLWRDEGRSVEQKRAMFVRMQLIEARAQPEATTRRSTWQGFDQNAEVAKLSSGPRDTFYHPDDGKGPQTIKPINLIVHERMALRQFVPFDDFDVAAFSDLGRRFYDRNRGERGKAFAKAARNAKVQAKKESRALAAARKAKRKQKRRERRELAGLSSR